MLFYMLQTVTGIVMATSYVAQDAASYHAIDFGRTVSMLCTCYPRYRGMPSSVIPCNQT